MEEDMKEISKILKRKDSLKYFIQQTKQDLRGILLMINSMEKVNYLMKTELMLNKFGKMEYYNLD